MKMERKSGPGVCSGSEVRKSLSFVEPRRGSASCLVGWESEAVEGVATRSGPGQQDQNPRAFQPWARKSGAAVRGARAEERHQVTYAVQEPSAPE